MTAIFFIFVFCSFYIMLLFAILAGAEKFQRYHMVKKILYFSCLLIFMSLTLLIFFYTLLVMTGNPMAKMM